MVKAFKKTAVIMFALSIAALFSVITSIGAGNLDYAESAPGGSVSNIDELIAAFGVDSFGNPNASVMQEETGEIRLRNSVILQSPIIIKEGSYRLVGGGCTIARGFEEGSLIVLDGSNGQTPSLELERNYGSEYGESDEANIILDGNSEDFPVADGSLISVNGGARLTLNSRVLFRNAVSSVSGGALSINSIESSGKVFSPEVNIFACRINNCRAYDGGAIYFDGTVSGEGGKLTIEKSFFTDCSAENDGGAIYTVGGRIVLTDVEMSANSAKRGGGAYICSEAELSNMSMNENTASISGGGLFCGKDSDSGKICEMSIISIMALDNHSEGVGGMLTNEGILVVNGFYSDGNSASGDGGSVYNTGSFAYTDGSMVNGESGGRGGAVYSASSGIFVMSGGEINSNTALFGGAVYSEGYFEMSGGAVGNNRGGTPEVIVKGETVMNGSAVVSNKNVIGLCIYTDQSGNEVVPVIKLTGELTNKAEQRVAFYRETDSGYKLANAAGMAVFQGDDAFIASAVKVFKVEGSFFRSYGIEADGSLFYKFPLMPVWAWLLTLLGVGAATTAFVLLVKKRRGRATEKSVD